MLYRPDTTTIGRAAYEAYCTSVGGKSVTGADLPGWDDLGAVVQSGWMLAAEAVRHKIESAQ